MLTMLVVVLLFVVATASLTVLVVVYLSSVATVPATVFAATHSALPALALVFVVVLLLKSTSLLFLIHPAMVAVALGAASLAIGSSALGTDAIICGGAQREHQRRVGLFIRHVHTVSARVLLLSLLLVQR